LNSAQMSVQLELAASIQYLMANNFLKKLKSEGPFSS